MERHTKLVELVASRVMHLQNKTATSSTRGEDLDSDKSMPAPRRVGRKFRSPAKKTVHKDEKELRCRVCFISRAELGSRAYLHQNRRKVFVNI